MFNKMLTYINDNKLKIIYEDKTINIINYKKILIFDTNKIKIECSNIIITILGNNLSINKLYEEELLIIGVIESINFGNIND